MPSLLPWHHTQWETLTLHNRSDRLPHALLLSGPHGLGKKQFAEQLAQKLVCGNPAQNGLACGQCPDCHLYQAGSHPDVIRVEPAENGAYIKVDQIRALCHFLDHTSRRGGYKIALLTPAEAMNLNAANSLLKTLEEPPPNSLLLLVTANPLRLPATIRSRCQRLAFPIPPTGQALAWLAPQLKNRDDPQLLLSLNGGAPLQALAYAKENRAKTRQIIFQGYYEVVSGQKDPVAIAELWSKNNNIRELCLWLISWHRDMIRLKMLGDPTYLVNRDLQPALHELANTVTTATLFQRLDSTLWMYDVCTTQVQPQLMMEMFLSHCADA